MRVNPPPCPMLSARLHETPVRWLRSARSRLAQLLFAGFVAGLAAALALAVADMAGGNFVREGPGVLMGAVLAFGGGVVTYRLGLDDQRRRTARALRTEILIAAEGTRRAMESLPRARLLIQARARPFTVTAPVRYPLLDALSRDLTLLHSETLEATTRFYNAEIYLITAYQALASDAFSAMTPLPESEGVPAATPLARQSAYIDHLEAYDGETWLPAARDAYAKLAEDGRVALDERRPLFQSSGC